MSTNLVRGQELVSSHSAVKAADFPYHTLDDTSRRPTPDPYHYLLRFDIQTINHPGQYLRYQVFPLNTMNNSLQYSTITLKRELIN